MNTIMGGVGIIVSWVKGKPHRHLHWIYINRLIGKIDSITEKNDTLNSILPPTS